MFSDGFPTRPSNSVANPRLGKEVGRGEAHSLNPQGPLG